MMDFLNDSRFSGLQPFEERIWLASPTMHGDEQHYVDEAFDTNWITTAGSNIASIETSIPKLIGCGYAVALASGTSALHMATRLAAEKLYGRPEPTSGALAGKRVFCSDVTFDASVNPVAYEDGEAVFIDTEYDTWNMDPAALREAFKKYPDVRLIVFTHLYGTPGRMEEIRAIADEHDALIIEDAAESLGARCLIGATWRETGSLGDYNAISFNGNKIITGSSGGMFLTDTRLAADKIRKWSTQSRENAPWYQHEEMGYNYRMSNIVAGVVRGQLSYLHEHIEMKRAIYERYKEGFSDLPVRMNPYDAEKSEPNFWLSCMLIDPEAMCEQTRGDKDVTYTPEPGKTCPTHILEALATFNAEGRPLWKPMHMQPIYRGHDFITAPIADPSQETGGRPQKADGAGVTDDARSGTAAGETGRDVGADLFARGLCLPSDIKMTREQQDQIIEIVRRCFL